MNSALRKESLNDLAEAGAVPTFALSCLGRNQRRLKERFAALYEPYFRDQPAPTGSGNRDRPRIGILVSRRHEGLFARCLGGLLARWNHQRFEIVILASQASVAPLQERLPHDGIRFVAYRDALPDAIRQIRAAACDLIYFWEVGSDPLNYFLPFARLAPVQCTGWGSTVTSGVPAVDYFLSSKLIETPASQDHYTEKLWRSKTLFACEPRLPAVAATSAAHFGLPDDRRLYVCFQNPLKIHPDADTLFAEILAADPRGLIVLSGRQPEVVRLLKERFARRMPSPRPWVHGARPLPEGEGSKMPSPRPWVHGARPLPKGEGSKSPAPLPGHHVPMVGEGRLERIVFLPPQPFDDYCRLLQLADVVLDPPHYGAGSSCYDLFSFNLPVVTLPGELIVGRITQACYRKMGVADLVVHSPEEYVRKAVQVATDRDYRKYVTERIAGASDVLYNDLQAVREHERFFEEALCHVT